MSLSSGVLRNLLIIGAALSLQVCGGGDSSSPSGPGGPVPTPVPTATPTPEPTADPPLSASCAKIGLGVHESQANCTVDNPDFLGQLDVAIQILQSEQPEIFEGISVVNVGAYIVGLIRVLDRENLCAYYDGEEMNIKINNDYSEHYDILTSKRTIRTGPNTYMGTCFPAVFPLVAPPLPPPPPGCPLPSSREVACGREFEGRYYAHVEQSIDELYVERPELFNFNEYAAGQGHPKLTDPAAYHAAMVDKLVSKGYCAKFDGEEIQLKIENELSEHYDVNYQDQYVRRGSGIYRGSCYPAAF